MVVGLADFEKFPYNAFVSPLRYCQVAADDHLAPALHSRSGGTSSTKGPERSHPFPPRNHCVVSQ